MASFDAAAWTAGGSAMDSRLNSKRDVPCAVVVDSPHTTRTGVGAALADGGDSVVSRLLYTALAAVPVIVLLRQIPESFDAASDIGSVTLDLAIGYIVGWIFYYLTVWRPRAVTRDKVLMLVARDAAVLAGTAGGFLGHLRFAAADALPASPIDRSQMESVVRALSPSMNANLITATGAPANIAEALDDAASRQEQLAAKIERWSNLVSVDLLMLIHGVLDAMILRPAVRSVLHVQTGPFGGLAAQLLKWFEASDALRSHVATALSEDLRRAGYDPLAVAADRILINRVPTK